MLPFGKGEVEGDGLENSPAHHEDFHVSYLQSVETRVIRGDRPSPPNLPFPKGGTRIPKQTVLPFGKGEVEGDRRENTPAYHKDFHVSYLQSVETRVIRGVESLP